MFIIFPENKTVCCVENLFLRQQAYARDDTTEAKRFCWEFYIDFPGFPVFLRNHLLESWELLPGEIKRFSDYQKVWNLPDKMKS